MHCDTCKCPNGSEVYRHNAKKPSPPGPSALRMKFLLMMESLRGFRSSGVFHFIVGMSIIAACIGAATFGIYWIGAVAYPIMTPHELTSPRDTMDQWFCGTFATLFLAIGCFACVCLCAGAIGIGKTLTTKDKV